MESPSAQLVEPSMIDFGDGPPSSPFVTEVDTSSRSPSKQHKPSFKEHIAEEDSIQVSEKDKANEMELYTVEEDKENAPQNDAFGKMYGSPIKAKTPELSRHDARPVSEEANLMPPPSTSKKSHTTSQRTPLKPARSAANTPKSLSRGNSFERTPAQSASKFQAGLDQRNVSEDTTTGLDDSCFTAFSEIPEMTVFANLGQSPTKSVRTPGGRLGTATPRTSRKRPSPSRSPSPTPRRQKTPGTVSGRDETTSFLIDFTQQMEGINVAAQRDPSPTKSSTESNLLQYINNQRSPQKPTKNAYSTPSKPNSILNLLDFELPPAPTPRSVPTITVRELESLKSSYLSQISSLKATLSGREAEVDSLKKAIGDAERRCGEAQEELREEVSRREHVEQEKKGWEDRGKEVESVLKSVKEEVLRGEAEKEDMSKRLDETEKRAEEAETRAVKAEERFADALSARGTANEGEEGADMQERVEKLVAAQIDSKIEAVSRELHAVYKEKHERKVSTLKKSYEARSEKKSAELQSRVSELEDQLAAKDATFSGPFGGAETSMLVTGENSDLKVELREQAATLARLESEMQASKSQQEQLERELKQERIEKGDLVAAVDEMLALQNQNTDAPPTPAMSRVEDFRKSISRPTSALSGAGGSALPAPGGSSRIGKGSALPGLNRSTSGGTGPGKSRMLANIERMGRTGSGLGNSTSGA